MRKAVIALAAGFLSLVYRVCHLLPIRRRIACLARTDGGVPLDFQLIARWMEENRPDWEVTLQVHSTKNRIGYFFSLLQETYYIATSRAVVVERICIPVSLLRGRIQAPVIQIWHALGNMKRFGYAVANTPEGHSLAFMELTHMHEGYDAVAISSLAFRDDFAAGFNIDPSIIFEAPLPRTDLFLDDSHRRQQREAALAAYPQLAERKTIVYCPTYRKDIPPCQDQAARQLIEAIDFKRYNLVFKPHPLSRQAIDDHRIITWRDPSTDPLFIADAVISDYSTVIYEAGLLGVPVYLYAYDWAEYRQKRGLNIDLLQQAPVLFTDDPQAIMEAIDADAFDRAAFDTFLAQNIALPEGKGCTQQMCERIIALAEEGR